MDFAPAYANAVNKVLPTAVIVIDKFHVIQEINRCLDNVRKNLQNQYRAKGISIRRFKKSRLLFMTNWEDLSQSAEEILSSWFNEFPMLYEAYMVKETFKDIYFTAKTYEEAKCMFDLWLSAVPDYEQFKPMVKTMTRRKKYILNYWHYSWTNAYTESVNSLIKKVEKAGRGYKFDTLRKRCILEINNPKLDRFNPREAEYIKTGNVLPDITSKKYQVYQMAGKPIVHPDLYIRDYLFEYLIVNSKEHTQTFLTRMKAYYERIAMFKESSALET